MATETMRPIVGLEIASERVRKIEELWNTRDPERVVLAYTLDAEWCSCNERLSGRDAIKEFLRRKWTNKLDYRVRKELWAVYSNRVVVSVAFEWHCEDDRWYRSKGVELWELHESGLIRRRFATFTDVPICENERTLV